jgi:hypothetical protein
MRLVDDKVSGEKVVLRYDPTLRMTQVDPDVESELLALDKNCPRRYFYQDSYLGLA